MTLHAHPALQRLCEQVRAAAADGQALRIRGGGSKDFYGQVRPAAMLDVRPLCGITSYQPSELVVTLWAGTPLAELEAVLAEKGQCLPFEPPHFSAGRLESDSKPPHFSAVQLESDAKPPHFSSPSTDPAPAATCGGMVASGLAGPARASVGGVRDYVLGLALLDGRAQHLTFGGQVMKNVAGYDVSRLMVGALGCLGVLTELSLKVLPVVPGEATLQFECSQAQALAQLNRWGGQPLPLNASCWRQDAGVGTLYLRLRGAAAAVAAACKTLGGEQIPPQQAAADWAACRDQRLPWFEARGERDLWRVSVPADAPVLEWPEAALEPPLVEWHGAQRWYRLPAGQGPQLRALAAQLGGHATLFRTGAAAEPPDNRFDAPLPPLLRIMRQIKREFDPAGIFNPGRLYPDF
ncbi:MAG: glycolate oxidase subunit GlcE [Burkholderiaceae bacterium]